MAQPRPPRSQFSPWRPASGPPSTPPHVWTVPPGPCNTGSAKWSDTRRSRPPAATASRWPTFRNPRRAPCWPRSGPTRSLPRGLVTPLARHRKPTRSLRACARPVRPTTGRHGSRQALRLRAFALSLKLSQTPATRTPGRARAAVPTHRARHLRSLRAGRLRQVSRPLLRPSPPLSRPSPTPAWHAASKGYGSRPVPRFLPRLSRRLRRRRGIRVPRAAPAPFEAAGRHHLAPRDYARLSAVAIIQA
jgi:hypothetical protein